jgi:hypothetical protein
LIEVSLDGSRWLKVADSRERPPLNEAFARERLLRAHITAEERARQAELRQELNEINAAIRKVPPLPVVWAGHFKQPSEPGYVMRGGDPGRKGPEVPPASISTLGRVTPGFELPMDAPEDERRMALAGWIVRKENPLTARVLANRIWHYHFGTGLVDTPSDFGKLGGLPTHPELLDWLALRLRHHGWRLKPLHREIMLSQTYRQSSGWREEAAQVDAGSRLLWRFPPRRLSAEELRDTMLSLAGALDLRMGGPGFKLYRYLQDNVATYIPLDEPGAETYRRAVYHHNARASSVDLLTEFDGPDCAFTTPRRASTTSPLQAMTLLNHRFTLDMAEAMAGRLQKESGDCLETQVRRSFTLAFGRPPREEEFTLGRGLAREHGLPALCRALLNSNELIYLD